MSDRIEIQVSGGGYGFVKINDQEIPASEVNLRIRAGRETEVTVKIPPYHLSVEAEAEKLEISGFTRTSTVNEEIKRRIAAQSDQDTRSGASND
ncbi:MAG: hypothetical protein AAGI88_24420 [Pseudomonadota bacterium]